MYLDSNIAIVDLFEGIVKSMRNSGVITSMGIVNSMLRINSTNALSDNDVISINGSDYIVSNCKPWEFCIDSPIIVATNWKSKAPYYLHGHILEISNILSKMDSSTQVYSFQKYPLIALIQDFPEKKEYGKLTKVNLRFLIMTSTEREYTSEQRYTNIIKPILYPLYGQFIEAIKNSHLFSSEWGHTKTDRLFWGKQLAMMNGANIMNDYIDAIEIENLELNILQ